MIKDKNIIYNDNNYMNIVKDIISNEMVQEMKQYRQHYNVSCFDHCLYVSYNLYKICRKHNLDYKSAARAGLVHDLFLYDWRKRQDGRKGLHAYTHPKTAYPSALKNHDHSSRFEVSPKYDESSSVVSISAVSIGAVSIGAGPALTGRTGLFAYDLLMFLTFLSGAATFILGTALT